MLVIQLVCKGKYTRGGIIVNSYSYLAIDKSGKEIKGFMEAESEEKLKISLKSMELIPLEVGKQSLMTKDINISFGTPVKARDLSVFCRQFVSMIQAGVTIIDTLNMLAEQTENKFLKKAIKEVQIGIEKGETLADSMAVQEKVFPSILINMVAAGEASGSLDVSFNRMAEHFEKDARLKSMIKKAMVYPIVVGLVAIVVVIVMLTVVVPNFAVMFEDLDTEMPAITVAVMNASDFIRHFWWLLLGIMVAALIALRYFNKTNTGKYFFGKLALRIPLFGKLITKSSSSRLARTLSTLLAAGVSLNDAVDITSKTMDNIYFRDALLSSKEAIIRGVPLSVPLQESKLFPPMVYHMIKIGEETGNIEDMLHKLADYYDEEVEIATQALMAALEPLIIIVLAVVVGGLIMAVMAPMLSMYQGLDNI